MRASTARNGLHPVDRRIDGPRPCSAAGRSEGAAGPSRTGRAVARGTMARPMRGRGLTGVVRRRRIRTTGPDPAAASSASPTAGRSDPWTLSVSPLSNGSIGSTTGGGSNRSTSGKHGVAQKERSFGRLARRLKRRGAANPTRQLFAHTRHSIRARRRGSGPATQASSLHPVIRGLLLHGRSAGPCRSPDRHDHAEMETGIVDGPLELTGQAAFDGLREEPRSKAGAVGLGGS